MKKTLITLAISVNVGLTAFGFAALLDSPYVGIRWSVCGDQTCVEGFDRKSPADGKVEPGDRLIGIGGLGVQGFVFSSDPDYISSRNDQRIFWASERALEKAVVKDRPVSFHFVRNGHPAEISLNLISFPLSRALARTIPQFFVGWTFMVVAYLVLRKRENEISVANFIIGTFACAAFITLAAYSVRDIVFPFVPFKILSTLNYIASQTFCYALFHMLLVFPRRKAVLRKRPWVIAVPYVFLILVASAHFAGLFDNTHLTTYMSMNVCLIASFSAFVFDFIREKHPVYRKQIQWIVFGSLAGISSWLALTSLPIVFGMPYFSQEISILPTVIYPLSFAFAVTKYRLMEIENIIDTAVIYGFTILILAGVEAMFLSHVSPYLIASGHGLPYFSVIAVLLIVFIYVPVRNFVKGLVERLFKRGKYDPEKEIQQFMVRLGLCDERSALEKFTAFVKDLLKPSGVVVLKAGDGTSSVLHADSEEARNQGNSILAQADAVWQYPRRKGTCAFGYELSEKVASDGPLFTPDLEHALFVPFITDPGHVKSGYLAVLLKKWNETAYSIKDVTLLNAISVNIANIIEAGELRKERAEIEERYRKEKDAVMKEMHDGLGNILTSITVTSQAAERMMSGAANKAGELICRIGEFSAEAVDFLRTGLTVLDNPCGDIGSVMESVKDRFGGMLESAGMELRVDCDDDTGKLRPGALVIMNLVRVIQEALTNILKHAGAKKASILMEREGGCLAITISDDGKGFEVEGESKGFGLANMRRRVEEMKGAMSILSSPENGTKIGFTIPLAAGKEETAGTYAAGNR